MRANEFLTEAGLAKSDFYKADEISFSPYLIVEVNALCQNLKVVQDLSRANKFIIIIPLVGKNVLLIIFNIKKLTFFYKL